MMPHHVLAKRTLFFSRYTLPLPSTVMRQVWTLSGSNSASSNETKTLKLTKDSRLSDSFKMMILDPSLDASKSIIDTLACQSLANVVQDQFLLDNWRPGNRAIETMVAVKEQATQEDLMAIHGMAWSLEVQNHLVAIGDQFFLQGKAGQRDDPEVMAVKETADQAVAALQSIRNKYISNHSKISLIRGLWNEMVFQTKLWRSVNWEINHSLKNTANMSQFTMQKYTDYCYMKQAMWQCVLPFKLGTSITDGNLAEDAKLRSIWSTFGLIEQMTGDYCDCFSSRENGGKLFTSGYICWPIVHVLSKCDKEDRKFLLDHYGNKDPGCLGDIRAICEKNGIHEAYETDREAIMGLTYSKMKHVCKENPKMPEQLLRQWFYELSE
jgi:hypothetical protein